MKNWLFILPWVILYAALFGAALLEPAGHQQRSSQPLAVVEYRTPHQIGEVIGRFMLIRRYPENSQEVWIDPKLMISAQLIDPQTAVALGRGDGRQWVLSLTATGAGTYHLKFENSTSARALLKKIAEHGSTKEN